MGLGTKSSGYSALLPNAFDPVSHRRYPRMPVIRSLPLNKEREPINRRLNQVFIILQLAMQRPRLVTGSALKHKVHLNLVEALLFRSFW